MIARAFWYLVWCVVRAYAFTRPSREINKGQITRWYLTSTPTDDETGPPGWYLHRINTADSDARGLHNHPWSRGETCILRGGYAERREYPGSGARHLIFIHDAGDTSLLMPDTFHCITWVAPMTWTLFHAGPKHGRGWGFRRAVRRDGSGPLS